MIKSGLFGIFNKRKPLLFSFFIILAFSAIASLRLFNNQFYTSHDGEGHVIRMEEFDASLSDGQFPVRIAKRINHGLGYPFFNFSYPFIYYLGEVFHLSGLSYVDTFKALMILSVIIGAFSVYRLTLYFFDPISSLVASLFFTIAPYKFLNMYVRGNVAESFGLSLVPLLLLSMEYFLRNGKWRKEFLIFALSILFLSHNITAFIGIPFAVGYFLTRLFSLGEKREETISILKNFMFAVILFILLTAFFWMPVVMESKLTRLSELTEDYRDFFPSAQEILYSPWGFGAYKQGFFPGKMSPQIGLVHEFVFVVATMLFVINIKRKKEKGNFFLAFLIIAAISLFFTFPISRPLWDITYPLQLVQHPWRFVGYVTLSFSVAAGFLMSKLRSSRVKIIVSAILLLFLLYTNRNHIRVNEYYTFHSPFLYSQVYGPSTTSKDEHAPRMAPRTYKNPNPNGDIVDGRAVSKRVVWKSNYHKFLLNAETDTVFRDNTYYFPGWTARIDGKNAEILYKEDDLRRLRVKLPSGKHSIEFFFGETFYRLVGDLISLFTFILIVAYNIFRPSIWIKKKS